MARVGERGRGDWKRLGSQNSGPYAEASGETGPVDIAAVRRDDALIDAIAGDGPVQTGTAEEYQLAALLADWRAEILAEPMPAGPDLDTIVAAVNQEVGARQARSGARASGRLRLLRPIAGAAAALALVFGGLTAFSYSAEPGDPLWRVREVVFSEQAQTTVVQRADADMAQAQQLIQQGKPEQAAQLLESASVSAGQVNDTGKKDNLLERWQQLVTQLQQVAPEVAATLVPTTTDKPDTTQPQVTTKPDVTTGPTTEPNTGGGSSDTTTVDPRILQTPGPGTENPTTGGPTTGPGTPDTQPTTEPGVEPSTAPTNGGGQVTTTTAALPQPGVPGGTVPPGGGQITEQTLEQPTLPVVPTQQNTVPNGGAVVPTLPIPGGAR
ncbi:anti-sigma-D factor RsdA [Nocardia crassostreae]|uniref:anti-sigma-D factor RsdA n=1 Tax=Nocardia crassostreae TaxID=53428 RepID=UPI000831706B|nr:anti-sigma-D factor RsdA [Nocardia crassostreae]